MELLGRVDHGVIVPQGDANLPEGATVRIVYDLAAGEPPVETAHEPVQIVAEYDEQGHLKFPLIRTGKPGTLHLTNQMIAEILDDEDASRGR